MTAQKYLKVGAFFNKFEQGFPRYPVAVIKIQFSDVLRVGMQIQHGVNCFLCSMKIVKYFDTSGNRKRKKISIQCNPFCRNEISCCEWQL